MNIYKILNLQCQCCSKLKILCHAKDHPWWIAGWSRLPLGGQYMMWSEVTIKHQDHYVLFIFNQYQKDTRWIKIECCPAACHISNQLRQFNSLGPQVAIWRALLIWRVPSHGDKNIGTTHRDVISNIVHSYLLTSQISVLFPFYHPMKMKLTSVVSWNWKQWPGKSRPILHKLT